MLYEGIKVLSEGEVYKRSMVCKVMEVEVCVRWVYSLPRPPIPSHGTACHESVSRV